MRNELTAAAAALWLAGVAGCDSAGRPEVALAERLSDAALPAAAPVCRVAEAGRPLPEEVRETSGLARSRRDPGRFWTHNDKGNSPDLYAVDAQGRLVQRVRLAGVEPVDWEDLEAGPCDAGTCLYVADTGDNDGERASVAIHQLPEPDAGADRAEVATVLHARYPDGARDAEALFALPSRDLFVVTKGRRGSIALYRYPAPHRPGETVTLERVRELFPPPERSEDRVTAATASPDGRWVGIRTYRTLYLYPARELVGAAPVEPIRVELSPLNEAQGESLVIADDGTVWLTSEAEKKTARPTWSRLQCTLPGA